LPGWNMESGHAYGFPVQQFSNKEKYGSYWEQTKLPIDIYRSDKTEFDLIIYCNKTTI
jgi:hypothetical protein